MGYETFEREPALGRKACALPAASYNLTRILLAKSETGCVFVPIRTMQYLAVIDREEIIFVDSQYRRWVELAWQRFQPQDREALDQPVAFEAVFYTSNAQELLRRLQGEFHRALETLMARQPHREPAHILPLRRPE